jgi:hypothetical protein
MADQAPPTPVARYRPVSPYREVSSYRPAVRTRSTGVAPWVVIAAAAAIAIGSFLPWVTLSAPFVGTISKSGVQGGDGIVSLVGAGVLALLAFIAIGTSRARGFLSLLIVLVSAGVAALGGYEFADLANKFHALKKAPSIGGSVLPMYGTGLYVLTAGAALALIAGFFVARRHDF